MKKNLLSQIILFCLVVVLTYFVYHSVRAGFVISLSDQPSSQLIATGADQVLTFQTSSAVGPNKTLELFFENGFDLTQISYNDLDFKVNNTDLNLGDSPGTGSGSDFGVAINNQTITFTQNDTDTISAGADIEIVIGLAAQFQGDGTKQIYNPGMAGSYKISLSGTFGDLGTISIPIITSDSVSLHAEIAPELSFELRNSADTDFVSGCSLGLVTIFEVSECSYRLAASTNAGHGFRIYIAADGPFRSDANVIADINSNGTVSQGIEGHGIQLAAAQDLAKGSDFNNDGDNPIPTQSMLLLESNLVYNYHQGNLITSSLVIHRAAVSFQTKTGSYNQQITYTIIANF